MSDLLHQDIATVQSLQQQKPVTLAAAATISPVTFLTILTGTTSVTTIRPPVTGCHMLALAFSDNSPGDILTTGNVLIGTTTISKNVPVLVIYEPSQAKYYVVR